LIDQDQPALTVPASTLDIRNDGPRVAVVGADGKMNYRAVKLGRDFGKTVEVVSGLQGTESLVVNPTTDLVDGEKIEIASLPSLK
jgi:hypothetical protein